MLIFCPLNLSHENVPFPEEAAAEDEAAEEAADAAVVPAALVADVEAVFPALQPEKSDSAMTTARVRQSSFANDFFNFCSPNSVF